VTRWLLLILIATTAQAQTPLDGATRADWPHNGGQQSAWRYSALDQVNTSNVRGLAPAWLFQTGDYADNLQATPIVVDGVMYLISARAQVFALNAATGDVIWQYKYGEPRSGTPGTHADFILNRGVAVGGGKVIFGTKDSYLVALDQKTGREAWKVAVDDPRQCGCNLGAAPLIAGDKVIIGGNGGEIAHRGYLTAFHISNGRLAWRWYVIPGPGEKGNETWKGDSWKFGGGAPWMTGSFDADLNTVYWGTGNAASDFYDGDRSGDASKYPNLYTASIVALDADTGKLKWHYQEVPDDLWDFDSAYEVILMDRVVKGQPRRILAHMNKSGLTTVLDRVTGEHLGVFNVPEMSTWIAGVTEDGKLIGRKDPKPGTVVDVCPSSVGAKSSNAMAYSPQTGYLYIPTVETCNAISSTDLPPEEGKRYMNGGHPLKVAPGHSDASHIDAWDPVTGKRIWTVPYKYLLLSSMLATAGNLVFTGDPDGYFFALDARTGEKLWKFQTGAGNRGAAISYSVNGRQYVAETTGWQQGITGGFASNLFPDQSWRNGSTLVVFALPEATK